MRYLLLAVLATALAAGAAVLGPGPGVWPSPVLIAAYSVGCLVAVLATRRPGVVLAMAQPPLVLLAATAIARSITAPSGGVTRFWVGTGVTLVGDFPLMAAVTAGTVLVGLARLWWLRARARRAADEPIRATAEPETVG